MDIKKVILLFLFYHLSKSADSLTCLAILWILLYIHPCTYISKVGNLSRGQPKGYLFKSYYTCYVLTRPKMPFKMMHRKEVTHSNGSYERKSRGRKLTDEMGRAKRIPMVHYRVMHRKRVTSELHDSYFCLMTIKHSISKTEWASNDYIIQLSSTSQAFARRVPDSWRRDVVGKATPNRGGPRKPRWSLGSIEDADKESQHLAVGPWPPVDHQENKKDTT